MSSENELLHDKDMFVTNVLLFEWILQGCKDWEKIADIDYVSAASRNVHNLYDYQFDPHFTLKDGSNEGMYLDLFIRGYCLEDDEIHTIPLGTFKTLGCGEETIRKMCRLYGELLISFRQVIEEHLDDLNRKGYDVHFYKTENDDTWSSGRSGCATMERAMDICDRVKESYHHAVIRDNLTKMETVVEFKKTAK